MENPATETGARDLFDDSDDEIARRASILDNNEADPKPKKFNTNMEGEEQVTDDDDTREPYHSQKKEVQGRIFIARLAEMGQRP